MKIEKLTDSEEVVMKAIWDFQQEPMLQDVLMRVNEVYGKEWKPQTVSTFLARLVQKNYLKMQRIGRKCLYRVLIPERDYQMKQLERLKIFIYNGNVEQLKVDIEEKEAV